MTLRYRNFWFLLCCDERENFLDKYEHCQALTLSISSCLNHNIDSPGSYPANLISFAGETKEISVFHYHPFPGLGKAQILENSNPTIFIFGFVIRSLHKALGL